MSTKCQTRWSNNYNCFQRRCIQRVPFLSRRYVFAWLWANFKKLETRVRLPELGLMNEMGTKCFDILSMFHGWLLRVLLQYSSPLLILISHYGIDCLCLQNDLCVCAMETHPRALFLFSNMPICGLLCNKTCKSRRKWIICRTLCVCVCDVFISVCAPHTAGGFEVKTSSTSFFF